MVSTGAAEHRVVVVRVEVPAGGDPWRIELLEVSRRAGGDQLLGRTTDAGHACRILAAWFAAISTDPPDARAAP